MKNNKLKISLSYILISGLLAIALVLTACGSGQETTTTTIPATFSEILIPTDYKTYTNEGLFSISYPPDWLVNRLMIGVYEEEIDELITAINAGLPIEESLIVFYTGIPTEEGYNPIVLISVGPIKETTWTLDNVVEAMMANYKDNPALEYIEFSRTKTTVDGREAVIGEFQALQPYLETTQYNLWMITLIGKTEWRIGCVASPEMFSDYEDDFYAIINSFHMLIE